MSKRKAPNCCDGEDYLAFDNAGGENWYKAFGELTVGAAKAQS